jgi:hypothetical protein
MERQTRLKLTYAFETGFQVPLSKASRLLTQSIHLRIGEACGAFLLISLRINPNKQIFIMNATSNTVTKWETRIWSVLIIVSIGVMILGFTA